MGNPVDDLADQESPPPRETLRPPVTHTYMMLSEFDYQRTNEQGDSRSRKGIYQTKGIANVKNSIMVMGRYMRL